MHYCEITFDVTNAKSNLLDKKFALYEWYSFNVSEYIRNIRDPEKPATLEDLSVVYEDGVMVSDDIFALYS